MTQSLAHPEYSPGLQGVIAGITHISHIDVARSVLTYRGYDVHVLADHCSFEECAYLVLNGELPNRKQLDDFNNALRADRELPGSLYDVFRLLPQSSHPMDVLKVGVATLALNDKEVEDQSHEANMRKALRMLAKVGTIVANSYRIVYEKKEPVAPDASLNHAANFLYMLKGEKPDEMTAKVMNATLILYLEHTFNASTFTSRVIVSTNSDLYSGTVGAIGALKGNLHGGANEHAMKMLMEIGSVENAKPYITDALATKKKIMGFGHREYRKSDSRAPIVKELGRQLAEMRGDTKWYDMACVVEKEMWDAKELFPNVDFPAAWVYYMLGIPIPLYTPIFAVSRTAGWSAHMIEQIEANRLIRPSCIYEGPQPRDFIPIANR